MRRQRDEGTLGRVGRVAGGSIRQIKLAGVDIEPAARSTARATLCFEIPSARVTSGSDLRAFSGQLSHLHDDDLPGGAEGSDILGVGGEDSVPPR